MSFTFLSFLGCLDAAAVLVLGGREQRRCNDIPMIAIPRLQIPNNFQEITELNFDVTARFTAQLPSVIMSQRFNAGAGPSYAAAANPSTQYDQNSSSGGPLGNLKEVASKVGQLTHTHTYLTELRKV